MRTADEISKARLGWTVREVAEATIRAAANYVPTVSCCVHGRTHAEVADREERVRLADAIDGELAAMGSKKRVRRVCGASHQKPQAACLKAVA